MASYLVTGISSFIGAALAQALISQNHTVVGVDTSVPTDTMLEGIECLAIDCTKKDAFEAVGHKEFAAIFHMALPNLAPEAAPQAVLDMNIQSAMRVLDFARKINCSRVIYASSKDVYGAQPDAPTEETACPMPVTFSGLSTLAVEHYFRLYNQYGINSTALRLFDVYGPQQSLYQGAGQSIVHNLLHMLLADGHMLITGNPNCYHDLVFIEDAIEAFLYCLDCPRSYGKVINVGGSGRITVGTLIDKFRKIHKQPVTVEYLGACSAYRGIFADPTQAKDSLHYSPFVDLQTGLQKTYDWYAAQQKS